MATDFVAMLEYDAIQFDGLVEERIVDWKANVGEGRTLLAQVHAEDVDVPHFGGQQLG